MNDQAPTSAPDPNPLPEALYNQTLVSNVHPPDWQNPKPRRRYDLAVLGGGPGGIAAARDAASWGARVALVERAFLGGDRLNVACVPSKSLLRTARFFATARDAEDFGGAEPPDVVKNFRHLMARMRGVQARLSRIQSVERLIAVGVDVFFGEGHFSAHDCLRVDGVDIHFKKAIVATGSHPKVPDVPGLHEAGFLTNENVFDLEHCPNHLLVVGGGPVGCEFAQAFRRFGARVTIVQDDPMFLPGEQRDAAQILSDALAADGVEIRLGTRLVAVRKGPEGKIADVVSDGGGFSVSCDEMLVGIGRAPNVEGLGLKTAGVHYDRDHGIKVDDHLRTTNRRIYAAGDVCMAHKFTHVAIASARLAMDNALFYRRRRASALTIPWCTFTDPEIAHVGIYVRDQEDKSDLTTYTVLMQDVDRAVTDGEDTGFVKIHINDKTGMILGATIVASHAGEMINGLSTAITLGISIHDFADVIEAYPTQAGAIKMASEAVRRTLRPAWRVRLARWWFGRR